MSSNSLGTGDVVRGSALQLRKHREVSRLFVEELTWPMGGRRECRCCDSWDITTATARALRLQAVWPSIRR